MSHAAMLSLSAEHMALEASWNAGLHLVKEVILPGKAADRSE